MPEDMNSNTTEDSALIPSVLEVATLPWSTTHRPKLTAPKSPMKWSIWLILEGSTWMEPPMSQELSILVNLHNRKKTLTPECFWATWMSRELSGRRHPKLQEQMWIFWPEDIFGKPTRITATEQVTELDTSWASTKDQLVFQNTTKQFSSQTWLSQTSQDTTKQVSMELESRTFWS